MSVIATERLGAWVGRRESRPDVVAAWPAAALAATLDYCRNVEAYPGLVVHGPLQTVLLLDLARRLEPRPVKRLEYRALHPLFHFERFTVNGNPAADASKAELWTANSAGNYALAGTAYF